MLDNFVMIKWITTIDYPFPSTRLIDIVISTQTKKEIHCPSVSLTKWRLRTIQLTSLLAGDLPFLPRLLLSRFGT